MIICTKISATGNTVQPWLWQKYKTNQTHKKFNYKQTKISLLGQRHQPRTTGWSAALNLTKYKHTKQIQNMLRQKYKKTEYKNTKIQSFASRYIPAMDGSAVEGNALQPWLWPFQPFFAQELNPRGKISFKLGSYFKEFWFNFYSFFAVEILHFSATLTLTFPTLQEVNPRSKSQRKQI